VVPKNPSRTPIVPVPDDAPAMSFKLPKLGPPTKSWAYHNADGAIVGYVARWDTVDADGNRSKEIRPITYCDVGRGKRAWLSKGMPAPRPLFDLPGVLADLDKPILICEGEKTRDAAATLFPDMVATTPAHGAKSPQQTDFSPCAGRVVVIATDHDDPERKDAKGRPLRPGREFGDTVCELARLAGAAAVRHLHPERLAAWCLCEGERVLRKEPIPDGWDLADALEEGWTAETVAELRSDPAFLPTYDTAKEIAASLAVANGHSAETDDEYAGPRFRLNNGGVEKIVESRDRRTGHIILKWRWFCSTLEVVADTRTEEGREWGRLLRIVDRDRRVKEWAMPMELLAGDGVDYRRELLSLGLVLAPSKPARDALHEYISTARPGARARCVDRTGWHGKVFVTFDRTIGRNDDAERIAFQAGGTPDHAFRQQGTLAGWQQTVARYAAGNSRLALAISAAFAAPLLAPSSAESGGFHFRGASSTGKSTALVVAGSAWGGGGIGGFLRSWRSTSNGTEGIAAKHCDALLCLDEIGQVAAHEAGQIAYMLANGVGKTRANRLGQARAAAEWRVLFLSSGEVSLAEKIAEDGPGRRVVAGQEVRIVDLPADAGAGMGTFETLHGFASADALARHLKEAASEHYGVAAPAFLDKVTKAFDDIAPMVRGYVDAFRTEHCPAGADGQVSRVAGRFGLVAAGGELATKLGILPWAAGEATSAAGRCFSDWIAARGGIGSAEEMRVIEHLRHFIVAHGSSRFQWVDLSAASPREKAELSVHAENIRVPNCVGYRITERDGTVEYVIPPENWRQDVWAGLDSSFATHVLLKHRRLERGGDGKPQVKRRLPGTGNSTRCYVVKADILADGPVPLATGARDAA
jgi:putative DNA primase/helicase